MKKENKKLKQEIRKLEQTNDDTDTMMRTWQKNSRKYQQKVEDLEATILSMELQGILGADIVERLRDRIADIIQGTAPVGAEAGAGAASSNAGTAPAGAGATWTSSGFIEPAPEGMLYVNCRFSKIKHFKLVPASAPLEDLITDALDFSKKQNVLVIFEAYDADTAPAGAGAGTGASSSNAGTAPVGAGASSSSSSSAGMDHLD